MNARYYEGARGQFLSQDPVFLSIGDQKKLTDLAGNNQNYFLSDPQQLNSYSYGRNNPITNSDPNGLWAAGVGFGGTLEAGFGLYGGVTLSGGAYVIVDDDTGDISFAGTVTLGSNAGVQGVGNVSYPANSSKNSGVVLGSASVGLSGTYMPNAKKPSDLAGRSDNKSVTLPLVSFQSSNSNGQPSYTVGLGAKGPGSVSSYPTNTFVVTSVTQKQLTNQLNKLVSSLQKLVKSLKSKK